MQAAGLRAGAKAAKIAAAAAASGGASGSGAGGSGGGSGATRAELARKVVAGHRTALERILALAARADKPLCVDDLQALHRAVMAGLLPEGDCGCFRSGGVRTGSQKYCAAKMVAPAMERLLEDYRRMETRGEAGAFARAAWLCFAVIQVHPWRDGNGRMGRLCLQYALLRDADAPPGAIRRMPFTVAVTSSEEQHRRFVDAIKLSQETLSVASLSDLIATAALHRLRVVAGAASARLLALDADAQGVPDGAAQQRKQKQAQREAVYTLLCFFQYLSLLAVLVRLLVDDEEEIIPWQHVSGGLLTRRLCILGLCVLDLKT